MQRAANARVVIGAGLDQQKIRWSPRSEFPFEDRFVEPACALQPRGDDNAVALALIRALRSIPDGRENDKLRRRIAEKLQATTGEKYQGDDKKKWTA